MENFSVSKRRTFMIKMEKVVREVGEAVLTLRGTDITDTHDYKGHEASVIDAFAREKLQSAIDRHLHDFEGRIRCELRPYVVSTLSEDPGQVQAQNQQSQLVLIVDEIEGTTNTKRCLAAALEHRPLAIVSMALSLTGTLKDLVVGAVYTFDQGEIFSAFRIGNEENDFLAFFNRKIILPEEIAPLTRADSKRRILVIGYSNSHRTKKGELEQFLYDKKFKVYDGCRASGMDIINLLRNSADAYIDLRHYWSTKDDDGKEQEAMLQVYDIAGVIPIALGCGLVVSDAEGSELTKYDFNSSIPLVIARPEIHKLILEAIKPLVEKWKGNKVNG